MSSYSAVFIEHGAHRPPPRGIRQSQCAGKYSQADQCRRRSSEGRARPPDPHSQKVMLKVNRTEIGSTGLKWTL